MHLCIYSACVFSLSLSNTCMYVLQKFVLIVILDTVCAETSDIYSLCTYNNEIKLFDKFEVKLFDKFEVIIKLFDKPPEKYSFLCSKSDPLLTLPRNICFNLRQYEVPLDTYDSFT